MSSRKLYWLGGGLSFLLLLLHAARYWPFICDDALISLRYADRMLSGEGLTWTGGAAVEGYSNLLWILAAAGLGALGVDLITALRVLGGTGMLAVLVALLYVHRDDAHPLPGLAACAMIAASGSVAVWTIGGLEQPLLLALLAWSVVATFPIVDADARVGERPERAGRDVVLAGVPLALLCWTRPDAPLVVACFCVTLLVVRGRAGWWPAVGLALLPAAAVLAQLTFRLSYYDAWVPNPAHIKAQLSVGRILAGLAYVGTGLVFLVPALALGALGVFAAWRDRRLLGRVALLASTAGVWLVYVVSIGGDIFPGRRHMLPAVVLVAFLAGQGIEWGLRVGWAGRRLAPLACGAIALLVGLQLLDGAHLRATKERWEWEGRAVGWLLRDAFAREQPLVAVSAAGSVPYFSGLPALDLLGLNDRHIATQPPIAGALDAKTGHDHGDAAYVLDRAPDLIMLGTPPGRLFASLPAEHQLLAEPRFLRSYVPVWLGGRDPSALAARMWARLEGRVGIVASEHERFVPAYLLQAEPPILGRLDPFGQLIAGLRGGTPARTSLELGAGTWLLESTPAALIEVEVQQGARGERVAGGEVPLRFVLERAQSVDLVVRARRSTLIRGIRLRALPASARATE